MYVELKVEVNLDRKGGIVPRELDVGNSNALAGDTKRAAEIIAVVYQTD